MKVFWLAMLAALLWGLAPVFDKIGLGRATPLAALSVRTIVVVVGLLTFLTATGGWREIGGLDSRSVLYLCLGGLAAGLLGQLVYYYALKSGEATRVVPLAATYPLVAALVSTLCLKEPVTPGKVIGAILIVLGVVAIRMDQTLWPK